MKVRMGFVSNSSSSSFVVAFPKGMELTETAVHEYLYGPKPTTVHAYSDSIRSEEAVEVILEAMKGQRPNYEKALVEAVYGWLDPDLREGDPEHDDYVVDTCSAHGVKYCKEEACQAERRAQWKAYEEAFNAHRKTIIDNFKREVGDGFDLYTFTFSDNDGSMEATLEHGNTFDKVKHLRASNH